MKKVFAILAVAGLMAACNSGENKAAGADSAAVKVDSSAVKVDTTKVDTTKAVDTAKAKM
jgi:PBP1b-binding outer membrane lipoprotein LpoB